MRQLVVILFGLLLTASAQAVVQPDGTFIANFCGEVEYTGPQPLWMVDTVDEVCTGTLQGLNVQVVTMKMVSGAVQMWKVEHITSLPALMHGTNSPEMWTLSRYHQRLQMFVNRDLLRPTHIDITIDAWGLKGELEMMFHALDSAAN